MIHNGVLLCSASMQNCSSPSRAIPQQSDERLQLHKEHTKRTRYVCFPSKSSLTSTSHFLSFMRRVLPIIKLVCMCAWARVRAP